MPRPKPGLPIDGHVPEHPWYEGGACTVPRQGLSGFDLTDLFYAEEDDPMYFEMVEAAKSICSTCDIRAMCLETALAFKEPEGVWGGMTPSERRSLVRRRRRAAMVSA